MVEYIHASLSNAISLILDHESARSFWYSEIEGEKAANICDGYRPRIWSDADVQKGIRINFAQTELIDKIHVPLDEKPSKMVVRKELNYNLLKYLVEEAKAQAVYLLRTVDHLGFKNCILFDAR